ncbi:MAG: hypothetical protein H6728_02010 [Myxococcales bacterium]|nr:hypothetical protein [Myxococcales bacterium]
MRSIPVAGHFWRKYPLAVVCVAWLVLGGRSVVYAAPPSAAFSGFSETLLRYYQQEEVDRIKNILGPIEILAISANLPQLPTLSFHLFGWGQVSFLDELQATGDLNTAYISYRDPKQKIWLSVGRQYLYQDQKVLHFDGARFEARLPYGFGVRVFGGFAVRPQFAPSADYFLTGVRLSHRVGHISEVGVTFLETLEEGRPAHEILGLDALVVPFSWLELSGSASADLHLLTLRQAGGRVDLVPWKWLRLSLGYEYATPSAFISKNSIFSVFSTQAYHEAYAQAWVYLFGRRLAIGADLRFLHLPDATIPSDETEARDIKFPSGEQDRIHIRWMYLQEPTGWLGLTLERARETDDGHLGVRLFWQQQFWVFWLALDLQYYHYSQFLGGMPHGIFAALSGKWQFAPGWELVGSATFTSNPFVVQSWMGLLKLRYTFFFALPSAPPSAMSAAPQQGRLR